jgi:hypothetical protein
MPENKTLFDDLDDPRLLSPDDIFERADEELLRKLDEDRRVVDPNSWTTGIVSRTGVLAT